MNLRSFLRRLDQQGREHFAVQVGTTIGHLNNVAYGGRTASAALARQIEIETRGEIYRWELRPTDWHLIWPELVGADGAPPLPLEETASSSTTKFAA